MKTARWLFLLTFLTPAFPAAQSIHNGEELLTAMHMR